MSNDHETRDHVISTAVSLAVGGLGFLAIDFLSDNSPQAVALAVVAGIITHLIFDRIAYRRKLEQTRNEIVESLRVGTPFESGYRVFPRERDATSYLMAMLPSAKLIWNTRISDSTAVYSKRFNRGEINEHDRALLNAIKNGAECRIVIQSDRRDEISPFVTACEELSTNGCEGGLLVYNVDFGFQPVTQMIIIETKEGGREVLIGWSMGKEIGFESSVVLFRDRQLVDFFASIFDLYTRSAIETEKV